VKLEPGSFSKEGQPCGAMLVDGRETASRGELYNGRAAQLAGAESAADRAVSGRGAAKKMRVASTSTKQPESRRTDRQHGRTVTMGMAGVSQIPQQHDTHSVPQRYPRPDEWGLARAGGLEPERAASPPRALKAETMAAHIRPSQAGADRPAQRSTAVVGKA
jgi:hypothetical protein